MTHLAILQYKSYIFEFKTHCHAAQRKAFPNSTKIILRQCRDSHKMMLTKCFSANRKIQNLKHSKTQKYLEQVINITKLQKNLQL